METPVEESAEIVVRYWDGVEREATVELPCSASYLFDWIEKEQGKAIEVIMVLWRDIIDNAEFGPVRRVKGERIFYHAGVAESDFMHCDYKFVLPPISEP